jgi:PKD repeat protein
MRLRVLIVAFVLVVLSVFVTGAALAQTCQWQHEFDFTASSYGGFIVSGYSQGQYSAGLGWANTTTHGVIQVNLGATLSNVYRLEADMYRVSATGSADGCLYLKVGTAPSGVGSLIGCSGNIPGYSTAVLFNQPPTGTNFIGGQSSMILNPTNITGGKVYFQRVRFYGNGTNPFTGTLGCTPVADFTFTPNNSPAPANVTFTNSSTGSPTSYVWNFGDGSPTSSETNPTHRYSEPGTYQVSLTATNASGSDTELKTVTVVAPGQPGGFLFRPITSQQRNNNFHADGLWSHATDQGAFQFTNDFFSDLSPFPNSDTVVANSGEVGVPVYAAADGFVLSVRKMSEMQCPGVNYIPIVGCLLMYTRLTISPGQARVSPYTISNRDLWEVVVSYGDDTLRYYVGNPENYIYEGMQLRAGCIVGEAVELTPLRPAQLQVGGTAEAAIGAGQVGTLGGGGTANVFVEWGDQFSGGVTFIQRRNASNVPQPLISFLTQEPDPVTACNASGPLSECFDDPYFENRNLWTATNPSLVTWGYSYQIGGGIGGVLLEPGAGIFYSRALDTQAAYSFIVYASLAQPGRGRIQLSLGQTVSPSYAVTSTSLAAFAIDFAQHTPDTANLYKVQIANVGSVPIVLKGNCLTANQNYAPDVCYFQNYSFDRGSDEWSLYGVVGGGNTQDGELWMTDGSAIGQNVQLYPDTGGPHVYQFTVTYYFEAVGETPTTPYPTVQLQYRFNNDAWSNFGTAATYSSRLLRTSSQTMTHQISVATLI